MWLNNQSKQEHFGSSNTFLDFGRAVSRTFLTSIALVI